MPSQVSFKTSKGRDVNQLFDSIVKSSKSTTGDMLYAGQRQRSRCLDRTQRGVDFNGQAFKPYSTRGPYYFYPSKGSKTLAGRKSAITRLANKIGAPKTGAFKTLKSKRTGILGRTLLGIKFASYAAFKAAFGRSGVDLRGIQAPHMLQAIVVRSGGTTLGAGTIGAASDSTQAADQVVIGIYGEEASRAEGHNEGIPGRLPKRRFLSASSSDRTDFLNDIVKRIAARMRKQIAGNA